MREDDNIHIPEEGFIEEWLNKENVRAPTSFRIFELAKKINGKTIEKNVKILSSDSLQGRNTGELGQKKAARFLKNYYIQHHIASPKSLDYFQTIPADYFNKKSNSDSENVLAFVEGTDKKQEIVVVCAHYDHLGVNDKGEIFHGADDNGSGTAVLMEIARVLKLANVYGIRPQRSILFLHVTGEEIGLYGSKYYVEHPVFELDHTVANINIDMIGRIDERHKDNPSYVYTVGSDRISKELKEINESLNEDHIGLSLDYRYDEVNDPLGVYYRSDHYNFAKNGIPVIFYFSGLHKDYHQPTDTYEKLNYNLMEKRSQLAFLTIWEVANRANRLSIDPPSKKSAQKNRILWHRKR